MRVDRIVPNLTVTDLPGAVSEHQAALGLEVLMDHGWIVTLGDADGAHQVSLMTTDPTGPVNPVASIFVDDVYQALDRVHAAGLEVIYSVRQEQWGVTRFIYRDTSGNAINVGMHT